MKKKIIGIIIGTAIIVLMVINIQVIPNAQSNNLILSSLMEQAYADSEVSACLGNYIYEGSKAPVNSQKCYSDVSGGPDIFNGYVVTCPNGGRGCQPTFCVEGNGCFTTEI